MAIGVTSAGQLSIRWIGNKLNEYLNNLLKTENQDYVIASDTDSVYLNLGPLVQKVFQSEVEISKIVSFMDKVCDDKLQPYIDKSFQELAEYVNAYKQKMRMKREVLADKGIWVAKKRYILNVHNNEGVQYKEPHIKVSGLEMVKSSTPEVVRNKMNELVKVIVNSDEDAVIQFIENFRHDFHNLPPEDVAFPRGCNGLEDYADPVTLYRKGTPIHVKGAILYNHYLKQKELSHKYPFIKEGEKLKFTYLKTPNPFKDTVVSFPTRLPKEFGLHPYVDYDEQFTKTFIDPIKLILDSIGWKTERVNSLEDFFQ